MSQVWNHLTNTPRKEDNNGVVRQLCRNNSKSSYSVISGISEERERESKRERGGGGDRESERMGRVRERKISRRAEYKEWGYVSNIHTHTHKSGIFVHFFSFSFDFSLSLSGCCCAIMSDTKAFICDIFSSHQLVMNRLRKQKNKISHSYITCNRNEKREKKPSASEVAKYSYPYGYNMPTEYI